MVHSLNVDPQLSQAWTRGLRRLRRKFNAHLLLSLSRPHLLAWFWFGAAAILAWRCGWDGRTLGAIAGVVMGLWSAWLGRRFGLVAYRDEDILRELDRALELHHALYCAQRQLSPWPDLALLRQAQQRYRVNGPKALGVPTIGLGFLLVATWFPINDQPAPLPAVVNPWAVQDMEQWLKQLEADQNFDPETLKNWAKSLEEIREKSNSATAQEAASLREAIDRHHEDLKAAIGEAQNTLSELKVQSQELQKSGARPQSPLTPQSASVNKSASERMDQLLAKARKMQLSWSPSTMKGKDSKALKVENIQGLNRLPELQASLQESLANCKKCTGKMSGQGGDHCGAEGKAGNGGVSRGRGDAPLRFGAPKETLLLSSLEALPQSQSPQVGDKMETQLQHPETNPNPWQSGQNGAQVELPAKVSGVIWKNRLRPEEQQILFRFHKSSQPKKTQP